MLIKTREVLEKVKAEQMNKAYCGFVWESMFDPYGRNKEPYAISWSTFRKYATLEYVEVLTPYTLEELVGLLNMGGCDDGYDFIIRDGVAYSRSMKYKLTGIKFE